jgi:2-polyprenyl-3-methyl-5-hydroxy-6-metoxy-1,4-benzoquinol methylase
MLDRVPRLWRRKSTTAQAPTRSTDRPDRQTIGAELGAEFYDEAYATRAAYHVHYSQSPYYFLWCVILDRLRRTSVRRLIDIGCGPGQFAQLVSDNLDVDLLGVDFSGTAIELARANCPGQRFLCEDMRTSTLLRTTLYDHLVCLEFLEHVEFDLDVLAQIHSGTRCFLSVPNYPSPGHVRYFTKSQDVEKRYGEIFHSFEISYWLYQKSYNAGFYLLDGLKN